MEEEKAGARRRGENRKEQSQKEPREQIDYTHFISVPIRDPVIRQN